MFLKTHFRLPLGNPVIFAGQTEAGAYTPEIATRFATDPPPGVTGPPAGKIWMPVIPLVGKACDIALKPVRGAISKDTIGTIADLILKRLDAMKDPLLDQAPFDWFLKGCVGLLCAWTARVLVRAKLADALTRAFSPDVKA